MVVATQLARTEHNAYSPVFGWASQAQACAMTQAQLAWYRAMEEARRNGLQCVTAPTLDDHLARWNDVEEHRLNVSNLPIGYILSLEGADSLLSPRHLERAFERRDCARSARRIMGRVFMRRAPMRPADSMRAGASCCAEIERLGLILDVTHLCDECFWEALETFPGRCGPAITIAGRWCRRSGN